MAENSDDETGDDAQTRSEIWKRSGIIAYVVVSNAGLAYVIWRWIGSQEMGSPMSWNLSEWAAAAVWIGPTILVALFVTVLVPYLSWSAMNQPGADSAHEPYPNDRESRDERDDAASRESSGEDYVFEFDADDEPAEEEVPGESTAEVESS